MKLNIILVLICIGALLVLLPMTFGYAFQDAANRQQNYYKALERLQRIQPSSGSYNHNQAIREADDLGPPQMPGYVAQTVGVLMILVGIWRSRSRWMDGGKSGAASVRTPATPTVDSPEPKVAVPSPS